MEERMNQRFPWRQFLTELIGTALLKAVDDISEAFGGTGGMADAVDTSTQAMADFITGVSMSINPLADFVGGINASTGSTFDFTDVLKVAYLPFLPLINATENYVDAGADARKRMEQQEASSAVLSARLIGLAGDYVRTTGAAINFGRYVVAPDGTDWANFYAVNQSGSKALGEAQNNVNKLTANYTIWGTVTQGLDIVKAIAKAGVRGGGADGAPSQQIEIKRVTVSN
jgi:hypothetical protein